MQWIELERDKRKPPHEGFYRVQISVGDRTYGFGSLFWSARFGWCTARGRNPYRGIVTAWLDQSGETTP